MYKADKSNYTDANTGNSARTGARVYIKFSTSISINVDTNIDISISIQICKLMPYKNIGKISILPNLLNKAINVGNKLANIAKIRSLSNLPNALVNIRKNKNTISVLT